MYLVDRIKSFLSKHQCRLIFQGTPKVFSPVAGGTPQGSPISPLLYVLYMASLHPTLPQGLAISYIDDLTITVGSDSVRSNIRALQYYFGSIQRPGAVLGEAFSVPKTELIHGRTPKAFGCFLRPHCDQRHAVSTLPSCEVARLLAHPYSTLLRSLPEIAGISQSLFHYNPTAQCSWQRPLLLVQQKASLRGHSSYSHLRLRPFCSGYSHSQETKLVLACGAPMDNQLLLHDCPRHSVL